MREALAVVLALGLPGAVAAQEAPARMERLSFAQVLERALQRNPQIELANGDVRRAEAQVEQARAPSLPTLTGNGVYTRQDAERTLGDRVVAGQNQLSANLTAQVPLVAGQRWAQWSRAADNASTVRANREETRRQVASTAARAYLTVVTQHRVVEVNERARVTAQAHLDFIRERLRGGLGTRLDEVRAAQELNAVVSQLELAHANLARAREALGVVVAGDGPVDAEEPGPLEAPPLDAALKDAREKRPDVKASEQRLEAAQRSVRLGWTDYLPTLSAVLQPFYQNPPSLIQPLTGWQAQLVLTLPLYDGGLRYGQQHEREAQESQARVSLDAALRQAQADVRGAFEALRRNDTALGAARDSAMLARQALEMATLAYQAGATTNLEVIDAERRARDAETTAALAEDNARQARIDLLIASGRFP
ncbi:MAG TPA: TolC family protein [Longimicrobium sp.]|nr:TolC family protein [Longimicrobium sp.]